jgi:hypothetical protein
MSEFKGTKSKWKCIFTSDKSRAIRSDGGLLMTFFKPFLYSGQYERYEEELKETHANQLLCSKAPEMLEMLKWFTNEFKDVYHQGTEINDMVLQAKQLIKEATEL